METDEVWLATRARLAKTRKKENADAIDTNHQS